MAEKKRFGITVESPLDLILDNQDVRSSLWLGIRDFLLLTERFYAVSVGAGFFETRKCCQVCDSTLGGGSLSGQLNFTIRAGLANISGLFIFQPVLNQEAVNMNRIVWLNIFFAAAVCVLAGCTQSQFGQAGNQNPFSKNQLAIGGQPQQVNESLASTIEQLNSKLTGFDTNNQELHTEVAQLKKRLAVSEDEKILLKRQMSDTLTKFKELLAAKNEVDSRLTAIQASAKTQTGAEIRANNSLLGKLNQLNLSGIEAIEDGDVIRIYLPTDRLFEPGTYGLKTTGKAMLDQVAGEIKRYFPRQMIGVEGHIDDAALTGANTVHQVSATQALAVFDYYRLTRGLPEKQMFILGQGANRPRFSNVSPQSRAGNRRIEVVVYPDSFD